MPGRNAPGNYGYKYGFNGKENDIEVVGTGEGTQDYGMRIYNPALGKFLSVDPLTRDYPWYTPYQFAGNKPIQFIDLDGAEEWNPQNPGVKNNDGTSTTQQDNTAIGYTGKYLDLKAKASGKGGGALPGVFDAVTFKLTVGLQAGLDINLAGKKPLSLGVNAMSKNLFGIDEGKFVYLGQKGSPTYSGASAALLGFGISTETKTTKTMETPAIGIYLPSPIKKVTETKGEVSFGFFATNRTTTNTQYSYPGYSLMLKPEVTQSSQVGFPIQDAAKSKLGIKGSLLIGIEANINIPKLLEGIENDFLRNN